MHNIIWNSHTSYYTISTRQIFKSFIFALKKYKNTSNKKAYKKYKIFFTELQIYTSFNF